MKLFDNIEGFDWDKGNIVKNYIKHKVQWYECEEVFFNDPIVVEKDDVHSISENRYYLLGKTNTGRKLFIIYTLRKNKIRIISARTMSQKERKIYEKHEKENT
ncbi:MAG: BrnT family toxin [Spirochaetes bacterium]|nr:BrnT family toxin [Spirochaetota bacterium]